MKSKCRHRFVRTYAGKHPATWPVWRCTVCNAIRWGAKRPPLYYRIWWALFGGAR